MLQQVNDYKIIDVIGEGSYGKVYRVIDPNNRIYAMKTLKINYQDKKNVEHVQREMETLKKLKHPNIIDLIDFIEQDNHVYLIIGYMNTDLKGFLNKNKTRITMAFLKSVTKQIVEGLKCIHDSRILHRDIKSSNILLDDKGNIKIADFSLSRVMNNTDRGLYTQEVVTLWYRPPEILLGKSKYTASIDIWSLGVLLIEIATGYCPFRGDSELSQLFEIFKILGTPPKEYLKTYCSNFPDFCVNSYNKKLTEYILFNNNVVLEDENSDLGYFIDLVGKCLEFDPNKRISVSNALEHEFLI